MKRLVLFVAFISGILTCWAQGLLPYTESWEQERDNMFGKKSDPGYGAKLNRQAMDEILSTNDVFRWKHAERADPHNPESDFHLENSTVRPRVQVPNRNVPYQVTPGNSTKISADASSSQPPSTPRSSGNSGRRLTGTTNKNVYTNSIRNRQDAYERHVRNEREKRERIRRENEQDFRRGVAQHDATWGQFYAQAEAQDRWNATEGVRRLEEAPGAIDRVKVPQQKQMMNAQEMASFLKSKKKGRIIVESIQHEEAPIRKQDKLDAKAETELYGQGRVNDETQAKWEDVFSGQPTIQAQENSLPHMPNVEVVTLFTVDEFNLEHVEVSTLPSLGCVVLIGDSIMLLDSFDNPFIEWQVKNGASQIVVCGNRIFGKQDRQIIEINADGVKTFCSFDTDQFQIASESDSTLIVWTTHDDFQVICRVNVDSKTVDDLLRTNDPVIKVLSNGTFTCVQLDYDLVDISSEYKLFYSSEDAINDICLTPLGLLMATDSKMLLFVSENSQFVLLNQGAKRVWSDSSHVYCLDMKNNFNKIIFKN